MDLYSWNLCLKSDFEPAQSKTLNSPDSSDSKLLKAIKLHQYSGKTKLGANKLAKCYLFLAHGVV